MTLACMTNMGRLRNKTLPKEHARGLAPLLDEELDRRAIGKVAVLSSVTFLKLSVCASGRAISVPIPPLRCRSHSPTTCLHVKVFTDNPCIL